MIKSVVLPIILVLLSYLLLENSDAKIILAGVAIFIIGMFFLESGFKLFSGSHLERIIQNSTNSRIKALGVGFLSTSLVQSSSLISIIVISFLSAELITLSGALGIVFGSNIGTTTTAWIISTLGVKINISTFALYMIIFGVIFRVIKVDNYKAIGNILIGLGFVFLGIAYMKDGFETLKVAIDLSQYAIEGYKGVFVYVLVGAFITVIIQSSSATMALIITALVTNQILYINALELAIGANIGTTITALIASITSNANGKRVAIAHFIFNFITALMAILFIYELSDLVDMIASWFSISNDDFVIKLALFHTIFNILGVVVLFPFMSNLEEFLTRLFKDEKSSKLKAKYLDKLLVSVPEASIIAIRKEIIRLYLNAVEVISHALFLHRHKYLASDDLHEVVKKSNEKININLNDFYTNNIKSIYGEIIKFSALAQENMSEQDKTKVYDLKLASRNIVEAIKDIRDLHKNISTYLKSDNEYIKEEYNYLRVNIANTLKVVSSLLEEEDSKKIEYEIKKLKRDIKGLDDIRNDRIDTLIREKKIGKRMATSLINDTSFTYDISKNIIEAASIILQDKIDITDE